MVSSAVHDLMKDEKNVVFAHAEGVGCKDGTSRICSLALMSGDGTPLYFSDFNPACEVSSSEAVRLVREKLDYEGSPLFSECACRVSGLLRGRTMVVWNPSDAGMLLKEAFSGAGIQVGATIKSASKLYYGSSSSSDGGLRTALRNEGLKSAGTSPMAICRDMFVLLRSLCNESKQNELF